MYIIYVYIYHYIYIYIYMYIYILYIYIYIKSYVSIAVKRLGSKAPNPVTQSASKTTYCRLRAYKTLQKHSTPGSVSTKRFENTVPSALCPQKLF